MNLNVVFWKEDGWYLAECTDIPGCMTQGATEEEVRINIADAINSCLSVIVEDQLSSVRNASGFPLQDGLLRSVPVEMPHITASAIQSLNGLN